MDLSKMLKLKACPDQTRVAVRTAKMTLPTISEVIEVPSQQLGAVWPIDDSHVVQFKSPFPKAIEIDEIFRSAPI